MKVKYIVIVLCFQLVFFLVGCQINNTNDYQGRKDALISISNDMAKSLNTFSETETEKMGGIIKKAQVETSGYAFLLDKEFRILIHPNSTLNSNEYLGDISNGIFKPLIESLKDRNQDAVIYDFNGRKKIVVLTKLSNGCILGVASDLEKQ